MNASRTLLILGTATLVACGGGSDRVAGIDGGGSPAPVANDIVAQGRITGFGSVIVNGVRYDTSGATISIDGEPGTESDLAIGQVVVVTGTVNAAGTEGTATSVVFDDAVEGPIEAIDAANETLTVLGQTVQINADTSFEDDIEPASLEGLDVGDIVEVSGYFDADGVIVATHIELEDAGSDFEVTGVAQNVDSAAMTFEINALVVDYSMAMLEDFPNGAPEDGQRVEAKGSSKTFDQRYQLANFGLGFLRLALETGTPIVPVAVIGGEEQYPSIADFKPLAKLLGMPSFPIMPQLLVGMVAPLPTRYRLYFGEPFRFDGDPDDDDSAVEEKVWLVKSTIQSMVNRGLRERKGVFI